MGRPHTVDADLSARYWLTEKGERALTEAEQLRQNITLAQPIQINERRAAHDPHSRRENRGT